MNVETYAREQRQAYVDAVRSGADPCVCGCGFAYHGYRPVPMCVSGVCLGCDAYRAAGKP